MGQIIFSIKMFIYISQVCRD